MFGTKIKRLFSEWLQGIFLEIFIDKTVARVYIPAALSWVAFLRPGASALRPFLNFIQVSERG